MTRIQYNLDEVMVIKSTIPVGYTESVRKKYNTSNITVTILFKVSTLRSDVRPVKGESPINNHSIECELPVIFPPKEKRTKIKS